MVQQPLYRLRSVDKPRRNTPMAQCTQSRDGRKVECTSGSKMVALLGPDPLTEALRGEIRDALVALFDEELTQVLGAAK